MQRSPTFVTTGIGSQESVSTQRVCVIPAEDVRLGCRVFSRVQSHWTLDSYIKPCMYILNEVQVKPPRESMGLGVKGGEGGRNIFNTQYRKTSLKNRNLRMSQG